MLTGQALRAVKQMKVKMVSMTVIPLALGENMTQVMSFLHSSVHMRMMPKLGQTPNAQGELYLGDRKFTSLSFDLCFSNQLSQCSIGVVNIVLCSIGVVNIVFTVSTMT